MAHSQVIEVITKQESQTNFLIHTLKITLLDLRIEVLYLKIKSTIF